jgi:hypothetical protein
LIMTINLLLLPPPPLLLLLLLPPLLLLLLPPPTSRLPDAMKPGIHGVGTPWIRGFMAFHRARRIRTVMLMGAGVS